MDTGRGTWLMKDGHCEMDNGRGTLGHEIWERDNRTWTLDTGEGNRDTGRGT